KRAMVMAGMIRSNRPSPGSAKASVVPSMLTAKPCSSSSDPTRRALCSGVWPSQPPHTISADLVIGFLLLARSPWRTVHIAQHQGRSPPCPKLDVHLVQDDFGGGEVGAKAVGFG